jgi:hypothetical protein
MQYNGNYPLCSANPIGRAGPMGLSDSSINNEGPLYGDGNFCENGFSDSNLKLLINNEGPLYGDGNNVYFFIKVINFLH